MLWAVVVVGLRWSLWPIVVVVVIRGLGSLSLLTVAGTTVVCCHQWWRASISCSGQEQHLWTVAAVGGTVLFCFLDRVWKFVSLRRVVGVLTGMVIEPGKEGKEEDEDEELRQECKPHAMCEKGNEEEQKSQQEP